MYLLLHQWIISILQIVEFFLQDALQNKATTN